MKELRLFTLLYNIKTIKMKKLAFLAVAAVALASCSSDDLVDRSAAENEAPIAFSVEKKNITRATNLEELGHYNFGVWAWQIWPCMRTVWPCWR